jgi:hypothetical protein
MDINNTDKTEKNSNKFLMEYYDVIHNLKNTGGLNTIETDNNNTSTMSITTDPTIIPTYIEPKPVSNEIKNVDVYDEQKPAKINNLLDYILLHLQSPILLVICYFIFQISFVKSTISNLLPSFFIKDGNINIFGLIITSLLFASTFIVLEKTVKRFQEIE